MTKNKLALVKNTSLKVVKIVTLLPEKYCDGVALLTHSLIKTILSKKKDEKKVLHIESKKKENFLKIKKFVKNTSLFIGTNKVLLVPLAIGVIGIILVKPVKAIAQDHGVYIDLDEYVEPSPTFYQRCMKKVVPTANLIVNTSAILNTTEFLFRSYWHVKNANYLDTFLGLTQVGLNTSTLAFGELARRSNTPEQKAFYIALQRSTLAVSSTVRLADLW